MHVPGWGRGFNACEVVAAGVYVRDSHITKLRRTDRTVYIHAIRPKPADRYVIDANEFVSAVCGAGHQPDPATGCVLGRESAYEIDVADDQPTAIGGRECIRVSIKNPRRESAIGTHHD